MRWFTDDGAPIPEEQPPPPLEALLELSADMKRWDLEALGWPSNAEEVVADALLGFCRRRERVNREVWCAEAAVVIVARLMTEMRAEPETPETIDLMEAVVDSLKEESGGGKQPD